MQSRHVGHPTPLVRGRLWSSLTPEEPACGRRRYLRAEACAVYFWTWMVVLAEPTLSKRS
jgi:hypothetical protein